MPDTVVTDRPINVLDPQFYVDPWGDYRWLRDEAPLYRDPVQNLWVVSRYEDIRAVERDGERYSSFFGSRPHLDLRDDQSMINMDAQEHQEQRGLVYRRFTPRAIRRHEEHVRAVATEILDAVLPLGECEAIEAIASRLPAIMIGDLLGYPRELWEQVRQYTEVMMHVAGQTSAKGPPHEKIMQLGGQATAESERDISHSGLTAIAEFTQLTLELVQERQAEPRDDLISIWAQAEGWDTKHALDETILVLNGGAETTRTVLGSMIRELALQPDQRTLLRGQPELLASTAVDEFIRWVSPVLNMRRTATVDHELHGQQVRTGDELLLLYAAANRDPRAYVDPDVLDVTRAHNNHVAFGYGAHVCLGAHLARLEIRVMFEEMLRRMPDWQLVDPDESQIRPATFARAYDRVRIRVTPS